MHHFQSDMGTIRAPMGTELCRTTQRLWVVLSVRALWLQPSKNILLRGQRAVVHDAKTVLLLQLWVGFRRGIEQFARGASPSEQNEALVLQITAIRFLLVAETRTE